MLTGADLVKFAKHNPLPSENESHFENSWNFVLATKDNEPDTNSAEEKISAQEAKA